MMYTTREMLALLVSRITHPQRRKRMLENTTMEAYTRERASSSGRPRQEQPMTQILIYHSKYGDSYWDASTPEKLESSARIILGELLSQGWITKPEEPMKNIQYSGIDLELAQLDEDAITALPTANLRDEAWSHKKRLARRVKGYEDAVKGYDEMGRIARGDEIYSSDWVRQTDSLDGAYKKGDVMPGKRITAWLLLRGYEDEYVSFELGSVTDPDEV